MPNSGRRPVVPGLTTLRAASTYDAGHALRAKLRDPRATRDAFTALRVPRVVPVGPAAAALPWVEIAAAARLLVAPAGWLVPVTVVVLLLMLAYTVAGGRTVSLSELSASKARLLVVLNPGCGPCVRTAEELDDWAARLAPDPTSSSPRWRSTIRCRYDAGRTRRNCHLRRSLRHELRALVLTAHRPAGEVAVGPEQDRRRCADGEDVSDVELGLPRREGRSRAR